MSTFHNITGSTGVTVELISPTTDNSGIISILLTNVHATADATVTLFIQDDPASGTTSTYNLIHTIAIPADTAFPRRTFSGRCWHDGCLWCDRS